MQLRFLKEYSTLVQVCLLKDYGTLVQLRGGGHLYFRLDIILVKGLSKHTLNTYFAGMKINPKYAFLQAFFLI